MADTSLVVAAFAARHRAHAPARTLRLTAAAYREFVLGLADRGIAGGSAYDALVAATAIANGAELVTCDRPALPVYDRYGVRSRVILP